MKRGALLRILDVNFNRSREGLRVCEEVARFILKDPALTSRLKKIRHQVSGLLKTEKLSYSELVQARNIRSDFGKKPSNLEKERRGVSGLFIANFQRTKESLRVLEESLKFVDAGLSDKIKKIRFEAYALEKKALLKIAAFGDNE